MRLLITILVASVLFSVPAKAQQSNPLPIKPKTGSRATSQTDIYVRETAYKRKYESERERREQAEQDIDKIRSKLNEAKASSAQAKKNKEKEKEIKISISKTKSKKRKAKKRRIKKRVRNTVNGATSPVTLPNMVISPMPLVFAVSGTSANKEEMTVIPLGSYVKARVLTGVEANAQEPYPMLVQLDHAFVGPNKTRIDMSHCFMIVKTRANLSTERVLGESQEISCVRDNGEHFKESAKGYIAGEDSTLGMTGQLISHQGQVLLTAVLANLAKGAGEAVALANTSTQVVSGYGGAVEKSTNITGSTAAYIAGKASTDAASTIAQWYLEQARQLIPSIAVGSGRDIWIVLLETVKVPPLPTWEEE